MDAKAKLRAEGRGRGAPRAAGILGLWTACIFGCAADPDPALPGSCSLQCSQPRAAAAEFVVEPMIPADMNSISMRCYADFQGAGSSLLPTNGPVQVKYQVYEELTDFDTSPGASATPAGGATTFGLGSKPTDKMLKKLPRAGIGFEPMLYGPVAVEKTNDEHKNADGSVSTFKFAGVVTPASEWCSDSCGVMTYEFWPVCQEAGSVDVTAGISVHGAQAKRFVKVSTTNE